MVKIQKIDPTAYGRTTNQGRDVTEFNGNGQEEKPKKRRRKKGLDYDIDEQGNVWENPNVMRIIIPFGCL